MDIHKTKNVNQILYSNYKSHNSTTSKIQRIENTFAKQMTQSNNYLMIIDEFYNSLKQKRKQKSQYTLIHKDPVHLLVDLIVSLIKSYNEHYVNLLNYDHQFKTTSHLKLKNEILKFEFNLSQIGIQMSNRNILKINTSLLKEKLDSSSTYIDFVFEENGLIEHLEKLYENKVLKKSMTHFDKKG